MFSNFKNVWFKSLLLHYSKYLFWPKIFILKEISKKFFFRLWWVDPCFTLDPATQPSICRSSYSSAKTLIIISSDLPCYEGNARFTTVPLKPLCVRRVQRYCEYCVCSNFTDPNNPLKKIFLGKRRPNLKNLSRGLNLRRGSKSNMIFST